MRGHVRRRGKRWQAIVSVVDPVTGERRQLSGTRATRTEADRLVLQMLTDAGNSEAAGSTATVGALLEAWQRVNVSTWSPATVRNHRSIVATYLEPRFAKVPLRKLRTPDIETAYADMRAHGGRDGKALSAGTVRRIHTAFRSALTQAVRWQWITDNPAARVDTRKVFAGDARRMAPPAPLDVVRLIDAALATDPPFGVWLTVAADTGARRGEVCALRWTDIDFDAGMIAISRSISIGDELVEKSTKTGNRRRIAVADDTIEALRRHRVGAAARALACGASLDTGGYVFSLAVDGSAPWRPDLATHRFVRLRQKLGLSDGVRLHDLRHFVATTLLGERVDLATVAGRLGHAGGGRTTLAVYAHMLEGSDRTASNTIADILKAARA